MRPKRKRGVFSGAKNKKSTYPKISASRGESAWGKHKPSNVSRFAFSLNYAFANKYSIYNICVFAKKDNPLWRKNFQKEKKWWRFTNISPFLWSSCWAYFADEIWGSPWLPIPFSIPLPASVSPSSYGDQTMRPHFEMIDDLSFWNDIQIYFRLIKGETVVSKWWLCLFEMTDGFLFEMRIWLPFRYDDKGFFSLCLLSKRQSFFLSYEKDRFSANDRAFRKDNNSLKYIEILSFQKDRFLSKENVLILI